MFQLLLETFFTTNFFQFFTHFLRVFQHFGRRRNILKWPNSINLYKFHIAVGLMIHMIKCQRMLAGITICYMRVLEYCRRNNYGEIRTKIFRLNCKRGDILRYIAMKIFQKPVVRQPKKSNTKKLDLKQLRPCLLVYKF